MASPYKTEKSVQEMNNLSFDTTYNVLAREQLGFNGVSVTKQNADNLAIKITVAGAVTYVGRSAPGTAQATAAWQCMKIDESSGAVITYADGNSDFDNVATDLTSLSYS